MRARIGGVPDTEDLNQLKELGYKTIIDLRDEDEKFGGLVKKEATALGLKCIDIPISRDGIVTDDVARFYQAVYEKDSAPIYAFSRFGRKPLAFLLLFEAVANQERYLLPMIYRKASRFGLHLQGDPLVDEFLVDIYNSGDVVPITESIRKLRPDLFDD